MNILKSDKLQNICYTEKIIYDIKPANLFNVRKLNVVFT